MGEKLSKLLHDALGNEELKEELIATKAEKDPLEAFCSKCMEYGYEISIGDLIGEGEEFCSAMLRSVNGGGVEAFDCWNDFYELFFASLEK